MIECSTAVFAFRRQRSVDQIAVEGNPWILAAYAVTVPRREQLTA
jgi:hypothetical protein